MRNHPFVSTSDKLLSDLREGENGPCWQESWMRFLELYHKPIEAVARSCYRHHTGGQEPSSGFIEDAVANTVADFFAHGQYRYDRKKGKLRTFLRQITNARVVDLLRKERPVDQQPLSGLPQDHEKCMPTESADEWNVFRQSLLASLIEDLRGVISPRQFDVFERVKLKNQSPAVVARDLDMKRAMVERNVYNAMSFLRQLALKPEYKQEFYE